MIIKIIGHDGKIFTKPSGSNPWSNFFDELTAGGHTITNDISDPNFNVLVMNSYLNESKVGISKKNKNKIMKILILWEPKQVNPKLYKKSHLAKYDHVYTPSHLWHCAPNAYTFNWPQGVVEEEIELESKWTKRKNKSILISGNKYSVVNGEMYSFRRTIIDKFSRINILDFGGIGWDQNRLISIVSIIKSLIKSKLNYFSFKSLRKPFPNLLSYIGPISDKHLMESRYRFSLVIENSSNYVSEKMFDSLASQNIVVYVGVDITKFGLNKNMVVQVDEKVELVHMALNKLLAKTPSDQYNLMKKQQAEYRKIILDWDNNNIFRKLAKSINHLIN